MSPEMLARNGNDAPLNPGYSMPLRFWQGHYCDVVRAARIKRIKGAARLQYQHIPGAAWHCDIKLITQRAIDNRQ